MLGLSLTYFKELFMSINAHLSSLETKHRTIETEIVQELSRPKADTVKLQMLKQKKLAIKDTIEKIKGRTPSESVH
jgi:hypothetical protein